MIESTIDGLHLKINNKEIYTRVCGEFNAYNLLAAYATCIELNLQKEMVLIAISNIVAAEGRFEIIKSKNFVSILDYVILMTLFVIFIINKENYQKKYYHSFWLWRR